MLTTPADNNENAASQHFAVLECPDCGTPLDLSGPIACCGKEYARPGGIIDFVGGRADTSLDTETYDAQQQASIGSSIEYFAYLKGRSNGAIGDDLGTVLELGAGTGRLTIGMLAGSRFDAAVITDTSPKSLKICKQRVEATRPPDTKVTFATFSGDKDIFVESSVDLCVAHSVLHRMLDYRALLMKIANTLKPGGRAIFVEPGAAYHDALSHAMSDTLCSRIAFGQMKGLGDSAKRIASMITDIRSRIAFADQPDYIAQLEGKYLFSRKDVADAAQATGFSRNQILPFFEDPNGERGVERYLRELGMTPAFVADFMPVYVKYAEYYFRKVDLEDQCEVYLIVLTKA